MAKSMNHYLKAISSSLMVVVTMGILCSVGYAADNEIQGAGSSLSNTLMQKLLGEYGPSHRVDITYKAVGSGEGIKSIAAATVDFALTDVPLTKYELDLLEVIQFPVFFSSITPIVNVPGLPVGAVKLSGSVLSDIYAGNIRNWNDPKILELNPDLTFPNLSITAIARSDASGSSYVFTRFLSKESKEWADTFGIGSKLKWPTGLAVRGTEGVIKAVNRTPGAIGYVEYGDALRNKASTVQLKVGEVFVSPSFELLKLSSSDFRWRGGSYYPVKTGEGLSESQSQFQPQWPIVAVTYSLIRRVCADDQDARDTLLFFDWILTNKNPVFQELNMITPQNAALVGSIRKKFSEVVNSKGTVIQVFEPLKGTP
jgi:phosphate transport system substrate-binding protein